MRRKRMKRILMIAFVLAAAAAAVSAADEKAATPWLDSVDNALKAATESNKLVLLYVYQSGG
jgi:opacity protein-like surface antigen